MRAITALAMLAVVVTTAAPGEAAPWAPRKKATKEVLNAAADAADRGDYDTAARLSIQSLDIETTIAAHWNAGQAYAAAGDWRSALEHYEQALADRDLPAAQRRRVEPRRELARAFVAADEARATARWDDAREAYLQILSRALDDLDRAHASGALDRVAREQADRAAADRAAAERTAGDRAVADKTTGDAVGADRASADRVAVGQLTDHPDDRRPPSTPSRSSRWSDTTAVGLLVVGGVGVGAGGWFSYRAQDLNDQAVRAPEPDRPSLTARADTSRTRAVIAFAAGGVVFVTGAIKFAIPPSRRAVVMTTVAPTPGGALLVVGGRF